MKIEMRGKSAYISGYVNAVERDSKTLRNAEGEMSTLYGKGASIY